MSEFIIGVDAGGTHTRAALANANGETLGTGDAGAVIRIKTATAAAQTEILNAIERAFDAARVDQQMSTAACLGVAGIDRDDERQEWTAWASVQISPHSKIVNDGELVLAAGSAENWGIALVAGTGSIAWGKSREGRVARAGGWGHAIGDEGSAYDLARNALRAASQYADGRGQKTQLLQAILMYWKLQAPDDLIEVVYRTGKKPADLAELAAVAVQCAEAGDRMALSLVENCGMELATMVQTVARGLGFASEKFPLAITGGLLLGAEIVRTSLVNAAEARGLGFESVVLVPEPLIGAVRLARRLLP